MVSWSLDTLLLALYVIATICSYYIVYKAWEYTRSAGLALFFLLMPPAFWLLGNWAGPLVAGVIVLGAQIYFIRKVWRVVGRFFVYVVICWAGISAISVRSDGWIPPGSMLAARSAPFVEQAGTEAPATEAYLPMDGRRVWYRVSGTGSGTPVILLHGGPGVGSFYLKPLEALGDDRVVVRYDQLGSGRSDKVIDTALFSTARFVSELDSLRSALGYERVHLVGHGWGTILGVEYYRANPDRVMSLTLSGAALDVPEWSRHSRSLLATLSQGSQQVIRERESTGDFDAPDYMDAVNEFRDRYVWRRPMYSDRDSAMRRMNQQLYAYMWGPSEFSVKGTLRSYDATRVLRRLKVPTLYTVGEFDAANPATIKRLAGITPGARVEVIPDAAHFTTWDNPEATLRVIREFLRGVDSTAAAATARAGGL